MLGQSGHSDRLRTTVRAVVALYLVVALVGCGATPTPVVKAPTRPSTATPTHIPPATTTTDRPRATREPSRTPSRRPSPSDTPLPSPSAAPSATGAPTLPPLLTPAAGEPLSLSLAWHYGANGHLTAGAVLSQTGDTAFLAASMARSLYAFDGQGGIAWQVRAAAPIYALQVLDGGRIAIGDDAGQVTALQEGGDQLWVHDLGSRITALRSWRGGLLAGGWDERLAFLDSGGQVLWQADLHGPVSDIAALAQLALAATLDGDIEAFEPGGGRVWRYEAGAPLTALGLVTEEATEARILAAAQDGRLLALDSSGRLRWQQSLEPTGGGSPVLYVASPAAGAAPGILVGSGGDSPLLALLSSDGELFWRVAVPSPVGAIAAADMDGDDEREILAGLTSGEIQVYDWQGHLRATVHAGLAVWGLDVGPSRLAAHPGGDTVLVRADVVAWQMTGQAGATGGPWLPPPRMLPPGSELVPPAAEPADGEAVLVFLGDVAPGRSMEAQLARYGPAYPWTGLGALLQGADLAVANLECVLTTQGSPLNKQYLIRAHPRWGQTLVAGGLDLLTLANNHALDYGPEGLAETLDILEALGLAAVGAGRAAQEAHRPALYTLNGVRVAILGYAAARWNGSADVPATDRIAWALPAVVQADVLAARDQADVVIVLLHAGTECAPEPSPDQIAIAHAALDAGADLVVGHHPHVIQTIERYGSGLIVYSLGDALFDIPRPAAMRGDLLRVRVTRDGLSRAELVSFWIKDAIQPRLLADQEGQLRSQVVYP